VLSDSLLNGILFHREPPDIFFADDTSPNPQPPVASPIWLIVWAILAVPFSLCFLLASEISWKAEGATRGPTYSPLSFLPACLLVMTNTIQLSMWWISFCRRIRGLTSWNGDNTWRERPPERIDRRPTGRHKQDQRTRQYEQTLDELRRGPSFLDRVLRRPATVRQRRLLLRALHIASMLATSGAIPTITLSSDRSLRQRLRRYKHHGFLGTTTIRDNDMARLRQVLSEYEPQSLYSSTNNDNFQLIVDTGCSHSATGCKADFLPGTIHNLETPLEMEGIAGGLNI
jgi:hypothetical protein